MKRLLRPVSTYCDLPATTDRLVARERFVIDVGPDAPVLIAKFNENFTEWFLAGKGKIEDPAASQVLQYAEPLEGYRDGRDVVNELGGEVQAETTLTALYLLMARQSRCEDGACYSTMAMPTLSSSGIRTGRFAKLSHTGIDIVWVLLVGGFLHTLSIVRVIGVFAVSTSIASLNKSVDFGLGESLNHHTSDLLTLGLLR